MGTFMKATDKRSDGSSQTRSTCNIWAGVRIDEGLLGFAEEDRPRTRHQPNMRAGQTKRVRQEPTDTPLKPRAPKVIANRSLDQ